jgi:conjugal transfer ATP-binding protein TraC
MIGFVKSKFYNMLSEKPPAEALAMGALPPTQAKLDELLSFHRLSELLTYQSHDPETGIFYNDDSYGFVLEVSPAPALDHEPIRILAGLFNQGMEAGTNIQICQYASPDILPWLRVWAKARQQDSDRAKGRRNKNIHATLARNRAGFFLNHAWNSALREQAAIIKDFRIFFSLTRPIEGRANPSDNDIEKLVRLRNAVKGSLAGAGFPCIDVDEQMFIDFLQNVLNPEDIYRQEAIVQEDREIKDQVVFDSTILLWGRDSICLSTPHKKIDVRSFSVHEYPSEWAGWMNENLIGSLDDNNLRISCPHLTTLSIHFSDQLQASSNAKMKQARATQMAGSDVAKHVPAWAEKRDEWQFVVKKIDEGHTMAHMNYQIVLFAPEGEGDHAEHRLQSIYKNAGWRVVKNRFIALNAFLSALPMSAGPNMVRSLTKLKLYRTFLTWTAANLAPMVAEWKGTRSPLMLLVGRRGQICYFDPWDNKAGNMNVAVSAASGAGKSVMVGDLSLAILGTGGQVFTFDRGRSYEKLCSLLGGTFIAFEGGKSPLSLNPFTYIKNWEGDQETGAERVMLKALIAQMANPKEPLPQESLSWIEEALDYAWKAKKNDAEITEVYDYLRGQDDQRKRDLADKIRSFTRDGFFGSYFTGPSNINLNNDYVVLEMKELDSMPELQSVVLLILMLRISQSLYLGKRDRRKAIIVDEAWKLMQGNAGEFIEELARTCRKHEGSLITITQSIEDYYRNNTARAAFENSDWVVLMRQKKSSLKQLVASGRLPTGDGGERILETVETVGGQYSELAIITPEGGMAIERLYLDPFSEKLLSTKGTEYQEVKDAMERGEDLVTVLQRQAERAIR